MVATGTACHPIIGNRAPLPVVAPAGPLSLRPEKVRALSASMVVFGCDAEPRGGVACVVDLDEDCGLVAYDPSVPGVMSTTAGAVTSTPQPSAYSKWRAPLARNPT